VIAGSDAPIKAGNTLPLRNIPVGTTVHGIELKPGKGAQIARAAGMRTMYEDGLSKALQGYTTIEEVLRVTEES